MARIEDYALIGDLQTAALVSREGSIDWCCFPRFDSGACFAALLGEPRHGRWLLAPTAPVRGTTRRYRSDTLILESVFVTEAGTVRAIDFMPPRGETPDIVRIVEGLDGEVPMRSELVIRYDFGHIVPWVRRVDDARVAVAGPDALCFRTPVPVRGENMTTVSEFNLRQGERIPFVLTWFPSHRDLPAENTTEAEDWRRWLLRAVAGDPADIQIMYGVAGERRLDERKIEWLPGYENSRPVRVGNAASEQLQLDVYGEVVDALYQTRVHGAPPDDNIWSLTRRLLTWLEDGWRKEDSGIWEVRGDPRHFTHSKLMAWVAFDRAVRYHEDFGRQGPTERWQAIRDEIRAQIHERAWNDDKQAYTQSYDTDELDASVLLMPLVGFCSATDERFASTVEAIERELTYDGLVLRYRTEGVADGLPEGEGVFLPCSFWLADVLALQGKFDVARELFERLLDLRNDVGLLAEEFDPA